MLKTFKASIETQVENELIKKGTVYKFDPAYPQVEYVVYDLRNEVFEFSKEDVIFSKAQKEKYKDYLHLNPFSGGLFADGVKYTLHRSHVKGDTVYEIEIDGNKAVLNLDKINKGKIEWVHGRKVNWPIWQVSVAIAAIIVAAIIGWFMYNRPTQQPATEEVLPKSTTNQSHSRVADTIAKTDTTSISDSTK
jgi:hypothetical protein